MEDRRWKRGKGRGEGIEGTEEKRGRQKRLRASSFSSYIDYISQTLFSTEVGRKPIFGPIVVHLHVPRDSYLDPNQISYGTKQFLKIRSRVKHLLSTCNSV